MREVRADVLIKRLSEELKKIEEIKPPGWSPHVKTGVSRERPPTQPDWWYIRAASMLRHIYLSGPVGVSRLRTYYGGRKHRGVAPEHFRKGGGKIARLLLQQLQRAGLVAVVERKGRKITPKGLEMLTRLAEEIKAG